MYPQTRKYYVILVHHKDPNLTHQALNSLAGCQLPPDGIIVIDHAEQPYHQPNTVSCHLIRPQHNTGYAGGINLGLGVLISRGVAEGDIVIAMNNDVSVYPDTFRVLRHWWQAHPADALLGVSSSHINLRTGRTHLNQPPRRPHHLSYIDGAFLVAPYRVFLKNKGLPSHYFMYWEDALFSIQVHHLGLPLRVVPSLRIKHSPSSFSTPPDKLYYLVRNGALFLERETSSPWRLYWYLANRIRLAYHAVWPYRSPVVYEALLDAVCGVTGPRKSKKYG